MAARVTERGSVPTAVLLCVILFANTLLFDNIAQLVTGAVPGFASVYTLDYGAQAIVAMVVMTLLVIVVQIFRRGIFSGLTAGAVRG